MGAIRRTNRKGTYLLDYYDSMGVRQRRRVHGGREKAREMLQEVQERLDRERHDLVGPARPKPVTLEELTALYKVDVLIRRRPRTWQSIALGLKHVLGWLATQGRPIEKPSQLHPDAMGPYVTHHTDAGLAPRTINLRVGAVKTMFNWAVREGKLLHNPLERWRPIRSEPRTRRRSLQEWEIGRLLHTSPPHLADLWIFLLGTGLRAGELAALEWDDIDLNGKDPSIRVRSEVCKTHRARFISLRPELVAILERAKADLPFRASRALARLAVAEKHQAKAPEEKREAAQKRVAGARLAVEASQRNVFLNPGGGTWRWNLGARFKGCLRAAGLDESLVLHELRHTFGSYAVAAGEDVKSVQAVMGHSSATVTLDVYAHAFANRKRSVVSHVPLPGADRGAAGPALGTRTG